MAKHYNRILTPAQRAAIEGNELITATIAHTSDPTNAEKRSIYHAALIGRCASASASVVVGLHERIEGMRIELADLQLQIDALRVAALSDHGNR